MENNKQSCEPECVCVKTAADGIRKLKIAICLAVVAAVCGILVFKTTNARQNTNCGGNTGFTANLPTAAPGAAANSAGRQAEIGASIPSVNALNTAAANLDTVFLIVPGKDNSPLTRETAVALATVDKNLLAKGIRTGVYTLQTSSPDYPGMAGRVSAPNIAVLTKGKGIGVVSGPVSESSLMQAYVASTSGGSCCPPGSGVVSVPCK